MRLAGVRREVAEAELTVWVARPQPARRGGRAGCGCCARTDEPAHRELALFALRRNGAHAATVPGSGTGRPLVASRGPRTGPLAIRARNAAGR